MLSRSLLFVSMASALPSLSTKTIESRQMGANTLFGPITLPQIQVTNLQLTLFNFQDEVFDISSVSIFGDVNDSGDCNEAADAPATPESRPGATVVIGPVNVPASINVTNIELTLFNFADEVVDISSIALFGNVNGGGCPAAA